jgi:hypothetical protein
MWADVTFAQMSYLDGMCGEMFGLELVAIIFSLPWALLMWSYVISSFENFTFTGIYSIAPPRPNRLVTFSVALLLFGFVISNNWTRIIVAVTSAPLVSLTVVCIRTIWETSDDGEVWWDGFQSSLLRALQFGRRTSSVLGVVGSPRSRPASPNHGPDGANGVRSSTSHQSGVDAEV